MKLNEAIQHAIDGNAVLFVGSGFSFGATSLSGDTPLSGRALAKYLYKQVEVEAEDSDLSIASQLYIDRFKEPKLAKFCREMFTIKSAAQHHRDIIELPWQRIYTTNYDDLIERAGIDIGRAITSVTPIDPPELHLSSGRVCLHINGLISRLTAGDFYRDFKLTFESYLRDALESSPWRSVLQQDLRLARAVIFIGYSMYDLDIARIVRAEDIKDKTIFILSPDLKSNSTDALRLPFFGHIDKSGVIKFATEVTTVKTNYTPKRRLEEYLALEQINLTPSISQPSNSDVEKLFLYGDLNRKLLGSHSQNTVARYYLVDRSEVSIAVSTIQDGNDVVLVSELGNGKTVALEQIGFKLSELGWNVFRISQDSKSARREISQLIEDNLPIVFMVDGYIPFIDIIDYVSVRRIGKTIRFLLASRSHVHDVYLDRLESALRVPYVPEFDLDLLKKEDANSLVAMIDTYGLWADFSSRSDSDRLKLIMNECEGQFHQVLLKLYEAPQVASKIKTLFDDFKPSVKKLVIAVFLIKATGLYLEKTFVDDLMDGSPLVRLSNNDRESVRFLWSDSGGYIRLKSSVLAEYYLTSQSEASVVVDVLSGMFKRAQMLGGKNYEFFMRSAMTYSALQKMLPKSGLRAAVVSFYEDIQNTSFAKKNPHYWLQYAIARLALKDDDFEKVEKYFKAAYAFAKALPHYDPYQIDNHYARFKLQQACHISNTGEAFELYLKAKVILLKQTLREQKHQPYRAAAAVADFAKAHGAQLDTTQAGDVKAFCDTVIERIARLGTPTRDHKHVVRCRNELASVKAMLDTPRLT